MEFYHKNNGLKQEPEELKLDFALSLRNTDHELQDKQAQ